MRVVKNIKNRLEKRNNYLKEKRLNQISESYKINSYSLEYGKAIKEFNKSIFFDPKKSKEIKSIPKSKFLIGREFPKIKGFDSREILVRSCYNLFSNKKQAIESLNIISSFLKNQKTKDKPQYTREIAKMFHQAGKQKQENKIEIKNNEFVKDLIRIFNEKPAREEYNARLNYVHSIANDFIAFCKRKKYFKIIQKKKNKPKVKSTYGARK